MRRSLLLLSLPILVLALLPREASAQQRPCRALGGFARYVKVRNGADKPAMPNRLGAKPDSAREACKKPEPPSSQKAQGPATGSHATRFADGRPFPLAILPGDALDPRSLALRARRIG
jgi:hypothetical protein